MDSQGEMEELTWTARTVRPRIAAYVAAVFLGFMAVAHFVFHSGEAVKALFLTAIGAIAATVPSILTRLEYRIDEGGLHKRPVRKRDPEDFEKVFMWDDVNYVIPTHSGFKYYKHFESTNPLIRFAKLHLLSGVSGEIHVQEADRNPVREAIRKRNIPFSKPIRSRRIPPGTEA